MESAHAKTFTVAELAERLEGCLRGPDGTVDTADGAADRNIADKVISGVRPISMAGPADVTFLEDRKYLEQAMTSSAGAIVVPDGLELEGHVVIGVAQPYVAFATLLDLFYPRQRSSVGISPSAYVSETASLGDECNIYPGAYIGHGVRINDRTDIYPGAYIGDGVEIGSDCIVYPNVTIYHGCQIGHRVILHAGVVIGADGFGFAQKHVPGDANEPVVHKKIAQLGIVVLEDDVEIGANTTVDRATMDETRICRGTKVDNLVQIGHNCRIGKHTLLVSQTGIGGSATLGDYVTAAGQAGIGGHRKIGNRVTIASKAGVIRDVADGAVVMGTPAIELPKGRKVWASFEHLPELRKRVAKLEKRLAALDGESGPDEDNG